MSREPLDDSLNYELETPRDADEPDPADLFVDELQRNPEVCSNCFQKIRDVVLPWSWRKSVRKGLVRYYLSNPARTESATFAEGTARNPPKACSNCGSIRGSTSRPLAKELAIEYAHNLSETLAQFGVEHNPLVLVFVVAHRKRFPEFASADEDTYRVAIEYAITYTRFDMRDVLSTGDDDPANLVRDDSRSQGSRFRRRRRRPAPPLPESSDAPIDSIGTKRYYRAYEKQAMSSRSQRAETSQSNRDVVDPETEPEFVGAYSRTRHDSCRAFVETDDGHERCGDDATHTIVLYDGSKLAQLAACDEHGDPRDVEAYDREWSTELDDVDALGVRELDENDADIENGGDR